MPFEHDDLGKVMDKLETAEKFKKPDRKRGKRKYKSTRQVMNDESKRVQQKRDESEKPFTNMITYQSLTAPPSLKPVKTYCDITGLPTNYKSPNTRIRFFDKECYDLVKSLPPGVD
ncbi:DEKNAAC102588, partial [Brettanomyces naardenensis]